MFDQLYDYFRNGTGMSPEQFGSIKTYFEPRLLNKNEFLLRAGETCKYMYFVNSGCIRFYTTNPERHEMTRYFGFENKFGTALTSFINQQPSDFG